MRRMQYGICSVLLLASCVPARPEPPQVLERAVETMKQLHAVRFSGSGSLSTDGCSFAVAFGSGVMLEDGAVWQVAVDARGVGSRGETLRASVDLFAAAPSEVDVRPRDVVVRPSESAFQRDIRGFQGGWWRLPNEAGGVGFVPGKQWAPFPVDAIVFRSEDVDGERIGNTYHYAVGLDVSTMLKALQQSAEDAGHPFDAEAVQSMLLSADLDGQVWIDRDTFFVRRISWRIATGGEKGSTMTLRMDLSDHNDVPRQSVPSDVLTLPVPFVARLRTALAPFRPEAGFFPLFPSGN